MKTTIQMARYLTAITLPDGRIYRHSLTASGGGSTIHRWGCVPSGTEDECGWGGARHTGIIDPRTVVEIDDADMAEIIRQADSGATPEEQSVANWYLGHVPYWGGVNDGNRQEEHGPRPEAANRAAEVLRSFHKVSSFDQPQTP